MYAGDDYLGEISIYYSLSNRFGIGSHEEVSGPNEDGDLGDYHLFYTISKTAALEGCLMMGSYGIYDSVDTQPNVFSNEFSDKGIGGTTDGVFNSRGDQIMIVKEGLPNPPVACATLGPGQDFPDGPCINIGSIGGGVFDSRMFFLCNGNSHLYWGPGDVVDYRCRSVG